jgi:uncharacterized membrane protein YqjE
VLAAAGVTLLYLGIGAFAVMKLKEKVRAAPPPFEASLAEFAKDRELMRGRDE